MSVEDQLSVLQAEVDKIKERNKRVANAKAWEVSWTRRIAIAVSTYILVSIFLITIENDKPFINAIVPAAAYLLSTTSLGIIKDWWIKKRS